MKLMEHSYIGNNFVDTAMKMISFLDNGEGVNFAWVGDYADEVFGKDLFDIAYEWMNYTDDNDNIINTQKYKNLKLFIHNHQSDFKFILNRTKNQFVEIPKDNNDNIFHIHPLPILTCYSKLGCSGDYKLEKCVNPDLSLDQRKYIAKPNSHLVGSWKFDRISVTNDINEVVEFKFIGWIDETITW